MSEEEIKAQAALQEAQQKAAAKAEKDRPLGSSSTQPKRAASLPPSALPSQRQKGPYGSGRLRYDGDWCCSEFEFKPERR